ncbi:MAG TPA: LPS assembly protein LptD [Nevskia sp.]|nr:LPS assembly protein LptD [Nevskia sp.]
MRAAPSSLLRLTLAALGLCALAPAQAQYSRTAPASCPQVDYARELPPIAPDPRLVLNADQVELKQNGVSRLTGSVLISQDGREFSAQQVDYSDADKHLRVDSQSLFRDPGLIVKSQSLDYDLVSEQGVFNQASYTLIPPAARGQSERIDVSREGWARLSGVSYTTCAPDAESWLLKAGRIELNQDTGMGYAHDATLWFQGLPLLYLPYFQFPIDGERHTGFLPPIFGQSHNTGFDLRAPFYLNLAPNYDATLIPRYMTERGAQLGGRVRYLWSKGEGQLYGEYLSYDQDTHKERSYVNFSHESLFNQRLGLEAQYAQVSDRNYFEDLGGNVDLTSASFLAQGAKLTYAAPASYTVTALVQGYQPVASSIATTDNPYQRLPQITLDALTRNTWLDTRAGFEGQFTNFARSDSVEGQRLIAQPYLRWQQDHAAWYMAAQTDLSYTYYNLTDTAGNQPEQPQRTLPVLSGEGGLHFERITDSGVLQTLEPKLFYLYVPYHAQDQLPVFDSGEPDFDFPELFARNRYTGEDRISDANQITSAVTTRLIDPDSGLTKVSASLGEIYRFNAPRVGLPGFSNPSPGSSDYIGAVEYQISQRWAAAGTAEWTSNFDRFQRTEVDLRYREPENGLYGRRLDIAYRYFNGLLQQADVAFSTPIVDRWRAAARVRYSLFNDEIQESFLGLEYQTCCWAIRGTYRRYISNSNGGFNNGVYFQLDLKGLSRLGTGFDELLPATDPNAPIRGRNASSTSPY